MRSANLIRRPFVHSDKNTALRHHRLLKWRKGKVEKGGQGMGEA